MRITIDIDGINASTTAAPVSTGAAQPVVVVAPQAPPEVLAQAAVVGAINAGAAPDFSVSASQAETGQPTGLTVTASSGGAAPTELS